MALYDERLRELQEKTARRRQLTAMAVRLRSQREALSARVRELEAVMRTEQADVDRLEGGSLAALFYQVTGQLDERMDKERQEAYAARVKYDTAAGELRAVEEDISRTEGELAALGDCEAEYERVLTEKRAAIKASGTAAGEEILDLEERDAYLESQKRELQEAYEAGLTARGTAGRVLDNLESAKGWGTWDLLGGGLIADLAKHGHLDEAQYEINQLQGQLRRFQTELADVTIQADVQVNVEGFLRFADYFFDGLLVDWVVLDGINQSREHILNTLSQIEKILSQLEDMMKVTEAEQAELKARLDGLTRETVL